MVGLIIAGTIVGLLLLVLILSLFSLTAKIEYRNDFSVKVKYLFITLHDSAKPKKKKRVKKKRKKIKKSKKNKKSNKSNTEQTFTEKLAQESGIDKLAYDISKANSRSFDFEMFRLVYDSAKPALKKLIRRIRIDNLRFNCVIGGDDAAKVALNYGFQSAAVSSTLAWLNETLSLKVKQIKVTADFEKEETEMHLYCRARIRVLSAAMCLLQYVLNTVKNSK
ncbi:MAG: DUF2953 domain-containing protein [Oscillospiraceae bacterium]|nr:DUF2953 domain-containing protein [Oscillospiraceae bacterium]